MVSRGPRKQFSKTKKNKLNELTGDELAANIYPEKKNKI